MPYLVNLGIDKLVCSLGVEKQKGISILQSVIGLVFLSVIGKKRVAKVDNLKDHGIAVLSGFSKLPSKSYFHEFLNKITVSSAENFEITSAKAFNKFGLFKGKIVNLDANIISYFGDMKIGKTKHGTRNISMRSIMAFVVQDQETGNPVFVRVKYPRKGLKPKNLTVPMLEITKDILPNLEKVVFDKWFSVGSLLDHLDKTMNLKFVTLIKLHQNRIEEMKSIPKDEFKPLVESDRKIAFKDTTLRNYTGNTKLIVVNFVDDGEEKYCGYLTNDYESTEERIIEEKSWRWRIENYFKECDFLGLDALPSIELNKIAAMMAIKTFSFCLVSCLKKDLGGDYEKMTIESIFKEIFEFPALVKGKGDKLIVTFHGNYKERHKNAVLKMMQKINETGRNVPIPWLGNRKVEVRFK